MWCACARLCVSSDNNVVEIAGLGCEYAAIEERTNDMRVRNYSITVGYNYRLHPTWLKMRDVLAS